jgi:hypothetical protein
VGLLRGAVSSQRSNSAAFRPQQKSPDPTEADITMQLGKWEPAPVPGPLRRVCQQGLGPTSVWAPAVAQALTVLLLLCLARDVARGQVLVSSQH